eukprot:474229-Amorphochlora_amoeboformis.AAC.3
MAVSRKENPLPMPGVSRTLASRCRLAVEVKMGVEVGVGVWLVVWVMASLRWGVVGEMPLPVATVAFPPLIPLLFHAPALFPTCVLTRLCQ